MLILILVNIEIKILLHSTSAYVPSDYPYREELIDMYFALKEEYPALVGYEAMGASYQKIDIPVFKIGNPNGKKILFVTLTHGNEIHGPNVLYFMAKWLLERREPIAERILQRNLVMIAIYNIDSYGVKRKNQHLYNWTEDEPTSKYGVDLNRNMIVGWNGSNLKWSSDDPAHEYYHGPSPASEPESQAMVAFLEKHKPKFVLDYHMWAGYVFKKPSTHVEWTAENELYYDETTQKIRNLAQQRGVKVFNYSEIPFDGSVTDEAHNSGSSAFLLEDGNQQGYAEDAETGGEKRYCAPYEQLETLYMPRVLPFLIVFANETWREFDDGFESGDFSQWSGFTAYGGEAVTVVTTMAHHGMHSALFASNGDSDRERVYSFKTVESSSELYARGYFYVSTSGLVDDNDRFHFLEFKAGNTGIAFAGWKQVGGVVKWSLLIRDGTSWVWAYSSTSPSINQWYSVELYWKEDNINGLGKLWMDGVLIASIHGANTAFFGDIDRVAFGLPDIISCAETQIYSDCMVVSQTYIGPEEF